MAEDFGSYDELQSTLLSLSQKYGANLINEEISKNSKEIDCKIGFLGEFSTGKSTLINALLGEKILPVMIKPTTKSIIEVHPKNNIEAKEFYEIDSDNNYSQISPMDFSEIALGKKEGKAAMFTKSNDFLKEGFVFIDTPGFSSIDEMDVDIAFGLLPELDGIVVCIDINKGAIPKTVMEFLKKDYVKSLLHRIVIALTFASTKSEDSENIRLKIKSQLEELADQIGYKDSLVPVVMVDGKRALENNSIDDINELLSVISDNYYKNKKIMQKERSYKILKQIGQRLVQYLEDKKQLISYNTDDLDTEKDELKKILQANENRKLEFNEELKKIKSKIDKAVHDVVFSHQEEIKTAQKDQIMDIFNKINSEVEEQVMPIVKKSLSEIKLPKINTAANSIIKMHNSVDKYAEVGKFIAQAAVLAIPVFGATGAAADAAEGTAADTLAAYIASKFPKLKPLAKLLKSINPIDIAANKIASLAKSELIEKKLSTVSDQISNNIISLVEEAYNEVIFEPLDKNIEEVFENIKNTQNQISERIDSIDNEKKEIEKDIKKILSLIN